MDHSPPRRAFKHLGFSLLIFGSAVCGVNAMARAPDSTAVVVTQHATSPATHSVCGASTIESCPLSMTSRPASDHPARIPAPVSTVASDRTVEIIDLPDLPFALRQQRNLFMYGGRLAPVDLLMSGTEVVRPTERTAKAPNWAMQLHAARRENGTEKERD
jgi:hypothetical protein